MEHGARDRESRSKTMITILLEDLNHRLNIMIMNANMDIMEKPHGTITKDTIINGTIGKRPWIPRMFWPQPIIGNMNAPEPTLPDPDHKTH